MKLYVYYIDADNSCSDPDCCGGPFPSPHVAIFSSIAKAKEAGYDEDRLTEIILDAKDPVMVD
jgi:hypothetical protein